MFLETKISPGMFLVCPMEILSWEQNFVFQDVEGFLTYLEA